jgi:predicted outer membrane repeat protein
MIGGNCGSSACTINSSSGGGLYNDSGTVTISNSTFSNNSGRSGGAIYNSGSSGTVTIINSTLSGNSAVRGCGAICNDGTLTITHSTLSGNSAGRSGGAIYNDGTVTITHSTLSGNSSSNNVGGAIVNYTTLTITHSTLSGNSGIEGGAIYNEGALTVSNSTLSGNSSSSGGGAIYSYNPMTITHSTFSGNSAPSGGGLYNNGSTVTLKNTLISKGASGTNCEGTITSNGAAYNLSNDASCGADVTQVASLGLSTLGANGGPTQTIPLLVGSPAVDAALAADCPADDQRGTARPVGAGCDIGAFEGAITLPVSDPPPTSTPSPALCSQTGFTPSTQVEVSMPSGGGGMNQCYSMLTNPAQVGITQPFTLAVEVYSFNASGSVTTGAPVQVCLQGTGTLLYRDASGQPRVTVSLPSFTKDGFTCGIIPNAGTVILIPGAPAPTATSPATPLSSCRVTTANIVNLRAAPDINSAILTQVPYQTVLNASARSGGWLQVVVGSQQGWVSESYVRLGRTCK